MKWLQRSVIPFGHLAIRCIRVVVEVCNLGKHSTLYQLIQRPPAFYLDHVSWAPENEHHHFSLFERSD